MNTVDVSYARKRRSIRIHEWIKPYIVVRPTQARRMLNEDFRRGLLNAAEESAIREYVAVLAQAENDGTEYPTWNDFLDQRDNEDEMTDGEWFDGVMNSGLPQREAKSNDNNDKDGE